MCTQLYLGITLSVTTIWIYNDDDDATSETTNRGKTYVRLRKPRINNSCRNGRRRTEKKLIRMASGIEEQLSEARTLTNSAATNHMRVLRVPRKSLTWKKAHRSAYTTSLKCGWWTSASHANELPCSLSHKGMLMNDEGAAAKESR